MDYPTTETYERYLVLLHDHGSQIRRYCIDHSDSLYEAQELTQKVMANIWQRLPSVAPSSTPRQLNRWLQRLMFTTFIDHLRHNLLRPRTVPLSEADSIAEGHDNAAELLNAMLSHLDEEEREIVNRYLAGYRLAEMAERQDLSADAMRQHFHRIVLKLRTIYKQYYE